MFELSIALKYLIPRKKQLSVSLIALLSVTVISLVVWLVLVFLSVTEGIERNWLQKLTTLNAPVRITPTKHYYSSYYYQIDGIAADSHYAAKNIAEKNKAALSDPYNPSEDGQLPAHFPQPDLLYSDRLNLSLFEQTKQSQIEANFVRAPNEEHHCQIGKGDEEDRFGKVAVVQKGTNSTDPSIPTTD